MLRCYLLGTSTSCNFSLISPTQSTVLPASQLHKRGIYLPSPNKSTGRKLSISSTQSTASFQALDIGEMNSIGGAHESPAHVLAIALPTQGHITPMLRFMKQLACKGITVSFVCFEEAVPLLTSSVDEGSSDPQNLKFRFVTVRKGSHWENVSNPLYMARLLKDSFEPLMEKLAHDKSAGIAGPTCIVSDFFLSWTVDVAAKLQIPRYMFITSGVTLVRLMKGYHVDYFKHERFQISETDGRLVEFDWSVCISGLPTLRYYELNSFVKDEPAFFRASCEAMITSSGVLVNSFFELEEKVIEAFKSPGLPGDEHIKVPKIYPVGPLFSTAVLTDSTSVNGLESSSSKCLLWLGSQPSSSVLYVAFGSQYRLLPEQVKELAHGLEASNQRFLWVIPQSRDSPGEEALPITDVLPPNFLERVGSRACIVTGWAPQLQILAHSSTGGFLTHSGWNSSLESVTFGVPMIGWPQGAEQHLNCRYLAEEVKVAKQLRTGRENILKRSEVERAVRVLMVEPEGAEMRRRVEELQRKAAAALGEGGSRSRFLQEFLNNISNHKVSPNSGIQKNSSAVDCEVVAKGGP